MKKINLVVGITGASGAIYAQLLLRKLEELKDQIGECGVIFSENAKDVWDFELGSFQETSIPFKIYEQNDFFARITYLRRHL